jgi:arylsulfatase A-like enzyme
VEGSRRPNVVLLVLDALRADAVEPFGAPAGSSPTLARLAERGVAVPGVRSTASWTLPAHTSMFTGQLARAAGLGQAPGQTPQGAATVVRTKGDRLLAEVLRRSGYVTWGVTTNMWCGKTAGFDTGFTEFVEMDTSRHGELGGNLRQRLRWDWEAVLGRGDDGAAQAEQVVGRWLSSSEQRPFFLFANLLETHSPYLPPRSYAPSPLERLRAADEAHRYLTFEGITRAGLGLGRIPERVIERMRRFYAACVCYADDWVGRLLDSLEAVGKLEDTLMLVCADHGENLGEGGLISHGLSLDDRLLRVPFIAAGPGAAEFQGMSSLVELPTRVAAAIGLSDHPWDQTLRTGLPVAQWDPLRPTKEQLDAFAAKLGLGEAEVRRLAAPMTCAVSGHLKLVRGSDESDEALYDLDTDPLELTPLREPDQIAARAGEALEALRAAVNHPAAQEIAEPTALPEPSDDDESADLERKMRLLGYM